jgi:hypothetical protein
MTRILLSVASPYSAPAIRGRLWDPTYPGRVVSKDEARALFDAGRLGEIELGHRHPSYHYSSEHGWVGGADRIVPMRAETFDRMVNGAAA